MQYKNFTLIPFPDILNLMDFNRTTRLAGHWIVLSIVFAELDNKEDKH
jgi:hypothetical protein